MINTTLSDDNQFVLHETVIEVPSVTWSDIIGLEEIKKELIQLSPVLNLNISIKYDIMAPKGIIFYGFPGCGKTLLAKAFANQFHANFISIYESELFTDYSESHVRKIFDKARTTAPCVLFFHEFDRIFRSEVSFGINNQILTASTSSPDIVHLRDRVINQVLTEIDGMSTNKNVFIIASTSRPDIIDPTFLRPGRLDQLYYIPLPDLLDRKEILKAALRKFRLAKDVDLEIIARSTDGYSGADITEICQKACKLAIRESIEKEISNEKQGNPEQSKAEIDVEIEITRTHFEESMKNPRKCVSSSDIRKYKMFQQSRSLSFGLGNWNFPEVPYARGEKEQFTNYEYDDDLYS